MSDLNACSFTGRLGADPVLKFSPSGNAILSLRVASNYRKNKNGQWGDETLWLTVVLFGKRAETVAPLLAKGKQIAFSGRLEQDSWTTRDGETKTRLQVIANDVSPIGPRVEGVEGGERRERPEPRTTPEDEDEEIPF